MEIRACRGCGKLYNYIGATTPACPACMKLMEDKFEKCRDFIRDNPGANIHTVSEQNEVSIKLIKQWVREERLTFAEGAAVGIECELCGCNILTGRYCTNCKGKIHENLARAGRPAPAKPEPAAKKPTDNKMRFLDK